MRVFTSSPAFPGLCGLLFSGLLAACAVTPEAITDDQRKVRVASDLEFVSAKRFAPTRPISLYDAMARAVAFNLQHSVRQVERDIAELELEQGNLDTMPDVSGDAGFNRDSSVTSTDTQRNIRSGSIGASWNLLDLGVSYARAKQSADRILIAEERRRKALQDIIRNVRLAYWKAVGAQRLMTRMVAIERDFNAGLLESRRLEDNNIETRRRTVGFRRGLIDTVRQLISARKEYGRARLEFAQLINIRPGVNFTLQLPDATQGIPALPVPVEEMASYALANRPELRVEDYNERITDWESREALYSMFPGLDLNITRDFSSDSGLINNSWTAVGTQLGMNLFRLFSGPLRMQAAERRGELARQQRLALSVAVLAQVYIAFHEYRETSYQFRLARQISRSDRQLSEMAMKERSITQGNRLDVIDVAARQLRSEVEQHRAYVELRRAHGDMLHSLGLDVIPDSVPMDDVDELRIAIRHAVAKWENLSQDTDPANDGTIEELVGQVFADIRRDIMVPGEPIGGARPDPAILAGYEMQGMIGQGAGSTPEPAALATAPIRSPPTTKPPMIAALDLTDMALAMTDGAMAAPVARQTVAPVPLDVADFQELALVAAPVTAAPTEPPPPMIAALDLTDMALAMTDRAMVAPAARRAVAPPPPDVADFQWTGPSTAPARQRPDENRVIADAVADPAKERDDRALKVLPPLPRKKRWLPAYDVQFGAYSENGAAQGLLADLLDLRRSEGADRRLRVVRKSHPGRQVLYHVQYGAYTGWTAAQNACNAFARRGRNCTVVRHKVGKTVKLEAVPAAILLQDIDGLDDATQREEDTGEQQQGPVKSAASELAAEEIFEFETAMERPSPATAASALPHQMSRSSRYGVQFGAYGEYERAQALLAEVRKLARPMDAGRRFRVVGQSHAGKQVLYHVQYGAYLEWTVARRACNAFARQGRKCIVVPYKTTSAAKIEFSGGKSGSPSVRLAVIHQVGPRVPVPAKNGLFQQF